MATLYRKYRPQNFEEVVGQNHIKLTLEHEIESGKIAHAYLFCGPRAVGKTTLARVFAKAINCKDKKEAAFEPCNECEICREITGGRALDIIEIDAASHTGVDNVRENIIASARVAPSRCKYKVFVIDEAHMLSISAFNALLKTIEEPPANVIFILCTTEVHKVPTTIISRCQRFDFKRISVTDIVKKLNYIVKNEGIKIDKKILEAIARQSEGHMRDAESLLGQIVSVGGKEITSEEADLVIPRSDLGEAVNLVGCLAKKDGAGGIKLINNLIDEGIDLKSFAGDLIEILRRMLLFKISPGLTQRLGLELGESLEIKINQVSQDLTAGKLIVFIERFIKAKNELKGSFIVQLPMELAVIELCAIMPAASYPVPRPQSGGDNYSVPKGSPSGGAEKQAPAPVADQSQEEVSGNIGLDQIIAKWNEVLAKVKQYNHSLSFILRVCRPKNINGGQLQMAFKYKFHKDRVDDPNIKSIIEKVLQQVYGLPLTVSALVDENLVLDHDRGSETAESKPMDNGAAGAEGEEKGDGGGKNGMIDNLLATFGGKIVS
ncbi:MAG: DNA polymerase III subunit gamma/tau [bacterium]|nr:DNA polymerase III subunit gamma/tau [bacterium]